MLTEGHLSLAAHRRKRPTSLPIRRFSAQPHSSITHYHRENRAAQDEIIPACLLVQKRLIMAEKPRSSHLCKVNPYFVELWRDSVSDQSRANGINRQITTALANTSGVRNYRRLDSARITDRFQVALRSIRRRNGICL